MKKRILTGICLIAVMLSALTARLPLPMSVVQAEELAVAGTILDKTTKDLLYLSTSGGTMQIRLDSSTDSSGCRVLLPGKTVKVSCAYGSDGYWHAARLEAAASTLPADNTSTITVQGTLMTGTSTDVLFLKISNGTMQIKLDADADFSACKAMVIGGSYTVVCKYGFDAYWHAVKVSDSGAGVSSGSASVPSGVRTYSFDGTVNSKTTSGILYLTTSGGTMQFKLDASPDLGSNKTLLTGQKLNVTGYVGSDEYWHAAKIVNQTAFSNPNATVDKSSPAPVLGTVSSKSTPGVLYLDTSGGMMQIRLDSTTDISQSGPLIVGQRIVVSCGYGSDEYWHALSVTKP